MTLIPIRDLAPADLRILGHNLGPRRRQTRVRPRSADRKPHPWLACPCPSHASQPVPPSPPQANPA